MTITSLKQAQQYGKITKGNSKILGSTFSTDPFQCKVGSKLRDIEGTVCNKCYAIKLSKVYLSALQAWKTNLDLFRYHLENGTINDWCEAMAYQINHWSQYKTKRGLKGANLHRWFSSGDIDSLDMLQAIYYVAKLTPNINHWLPTRERGIVLKSKAMLDIVPDNLIIRLSDTKIDGNKEPLPGKGVNFSSVHKELPPKGFECPAYKNSGNCGDCSACWDKSVLNVSYKQH